MRAKTWLMQHGHIETDGRGRMPLVSKKDGRQIVSILSDAKANGTTFSDWPKGQVIEDKDSGTVRVKRDESMGHSKVVHDVPEYRYTEDKFQAYQFVNGKKKIRSLREACNGCRVSLVVCYCPEPRIVALDGSGSVRVYIEPIKK